MSFQSRKVKVIRENSIGVPTGTYDSVECPAEYKSKFQDDIWVVHPTRKEPVRLIKDGRFPEVEYLPSAEDILTGMKAAGATPEMINEKLKENGYMAMYQE